MMAMMPVATLPRKASLHNNFAKEGKFAQDGNFAQEGNSIATVKMYRH